ncbi:MAG: hypothetical protein J7J28_05390 [Thaumarchaeota archaeon]|nr:hypothetical protein [Nitrososphaerota archaeon]
MSKVRLGEGLEGFQLTIKVGSVLGQRFSEVWIVGEPSEDIVEALKRVVRDSTSKGVKRLKLIFYLSNPRDLNYLNLLRPVLLENVSMSIVVEERSIKNLLDDVRLVKDEVNVVMGSMVPVEFMKAVELSGSKFKVVRAHGR